MKKSISRFLILLFILLFVCGCSGGAPAYLVRPFTPAPKEVATYSETKPLADIKLTNVNIEYLEKTFIRLYEISDSYANRIVQHCAGTFDFNEDWYNTLCNQYDEFAEKCNTFLKISTPPDMTDLKSLSHIAVINLYNAVQETRAAASTGNKAGFLQARDKMSAALKAFSAPNDYISSLYDRYPFLLEVSSVKISGKRAFVRFKNNENMTVVEYYVMIECRDKNGNAVLHEDAFDFMKAYSKVKIGAGKTSGSRYYWKLSGFANGYEYRLAITHYVTSDGRVVAAQFMDYKWSEWKH